ncbi:MAG: hypothetical protein AB7P99_08255 [Vicinamibacterales bacterium]
MTSPSLAARLSLIVGGVMISIGGPMHPGGTMAEMLADPVWFTAHALVTAGFCGLLAGLELLRRQSSVPASVGRWLLLAVIVTAAQTIDMAVHTMAYVDGPALVAGQSTPVLTTHLALTAVIYPLFGALLAIFIAIAGHTRVLGSNWVSWIGVLGCIGHGIAGPGTVLFEVPWARALFPTIVLVALWAILAGVWPAQRAAEITETA